MRILIVEEDDAVGETYRRCFAAGDPDYELHRSGTEALAAAVTALAQDRPFAVAFVDVAGAGEETARRLRALDADLNLVAVTAAFAPDRLGVPPGKLFHIAKPFAPAEVVHMAAALIARWAADRQMVTARAQLRTQVLLLEERRRDLAAAEARATHSATHDSMTGAPNRLAFLSALEARMKRPGGFATAMIDLDRFKLVNDTLGHLAGDTLIREMYAILRARAPADALVARLGGDEFGILFDTSSDRAAAAACTRMITACAVPVSVLGTTVQGGASGGVAATQGGCGGEPIELIRRADQALNEAKRRGRGGVQLFDEGMDEELSHRRRIEAELARALEHDELALAFQPIVERDALSVEGFEALLRWNHPERGSLPPGGFLAVAEESNLIHTLGDWVLGRALAEAVVWDGAFVAVNVSPRQFRRHGFARHVAGHLAKAGVAASRLQIEIAEQVIAEDPERAMTTIGQLQALGCRVALDDFGTGLLNLASLRRMRLDALKIDRSFVQAVGRERNGGTFLHALVQMGRALEADVVAEGVETPAQLQALRIAGATHLQGFCIGAPLCPDATRDLAQAGTEHPPARTGTLG